MHSIPLELRKCALLIAIPLYFRECAVLILNLLFYQKPDNSGRKYMTKTRSSHRNMMMTQT